MCTTAHTAELWFQGVGSLGSLGKLPRVGGLYHWSVHGLLWFVPGVSSSGGNVDGGHGIHGFGGTLLHSFVVAYPGPFCHGACRAGACISITSHLSVLGSLPVSVLCSIVYALPSHRSRIPRVGALFIGICPAYTHDPHFSVYSRTLCIVDCGAWHGVGVCTVVALQSQLQLITCTYR